MKYKNRFFINFLLGSILCMVLIFGLFYYKTIWKYDLNWVGQIPSLLSKICFYNSFLFVGISVVFGYLVATLFYFSQIKNSTELFKNEFKKYLGIAFGILVVMFIFNNWFLPDLEKKAYENTFYLLSTDKTTGEISHFFVSKDEVLDDPRFYDFPKLNAFIENFKIQENDEISIRNLKRYILKNSERILQPLQIIIFYLIGILTVLILNIKKRIFLFLTGLIELSVLSFVFNYFKEISDLEFFNLNLGFALISFFTLLVVSFLVFLKLKKYDDKILK